MGLISVKISILFLLLFCAISINPSHQVCPQGGKKGNPSPDLSSYLENGFNSHIDMVINTGTSSSLVQIEDSFNGGTQVGVIRITNATISTSKTIRYYQSTGEAFIINGDSDQSCQTTGLNREDKVILMESWLFSKDWFNGFLDSLKTLGPVGLIIFAGSISKDTRYMGDEIIDGFNVGHWAHCVTDDGPFMDFFFDKSTSLPVRLTLRQGLTTVIMSYLTFDKRLPKKGDPITFPYGLGCFRDSDGASVTSIPKFAQADTFSMDIEAAITYPRPTRTILTSARLARFQGLYSYDLKNGSDVVRIIHDPKLSIDYIIDTETGQCSEEESQLAAGNPSGKYLRWPRDPDTVYNLLDSSLFRLGARITSMGQVNDANGNRLDVFEKTQANFFRLDQVLPCQALITYFFSALPPTSDFSERHQAPDSIEIRPLCNSWQMEGLTYDIPKIEMTFFNYREDSHIDFEDRFDVSDCYSDSREFTWFQVVFPNATKIKPDIKGKDILIERAFREMVSFIPTIRLPEVRIAFFGSNLYVTGKLLERPSYKYDFVQSPSEVLSNPSKVLIREHEEDCGEICWENKNCQAFSYCQNLECYLRISNDSYPKVIPRTQCDTFIPAIDFDANPMSLAEMNLHRSSKAILHELKDLVDQGGITFSKPNIPADDVYVVSGPEEIAAGRRIDGEDGRQLPTGDEYMVAVPRRRLNQGRQIFRVTYESCLEECQDDDDCYSISYCPSKDEECTTSSLFGSNITSQLDFLTTYSDGCNIFSRKFTAFFNKLPGKALVLDAKSTLAGMTEEECAKACYEETGFTCESFDFCPSVENLQEKKGETVCFFHVFHISKDVSSAVNSSVWRIGDNRCDHYSRKLSKDYHHLVGRRLTGDVKQIRRLNDISLESCAGNCNSADEGCNSFEFCEAVGGKNDGSITSTCAITQYRPINGKDASLEASPSESRCSVYVAKAGRSNSEDRGLGLGLAMGLGAFLFLIASILGAVGAHFISKRRDAAATQE